MVAQARNFFIQAVLIAGLVAAFALSAPLFAFAQTYGECAYGEDVYGTGCTASTPAPSSGGGGGGGSRIVRPTATTTLVVTNTGNGLTAPQKQSILDLIASFGADATTLANVTAALNGQASTGTGSGSSFAFTRDLELNMEGEDVKALQQYLNAHGYTVSVSGAGSAGLETIFFGPATKAAVIKLQIANSIIPSIGYFGPITRAYVASH